MESERYLKDSRPGEVRKTFEKKERNVRMSKKGESSLMMRFIVGKGESNGWE